MEAVKQWEETEEVGVDLRGRLPHPQQSSTITTTVSSTFVFASESSASSEAESLNREEAGEGKEKPRNGTSNVSDKNGGTESPHGISGFDAGHVGFLTSEKYPGDEIVDVKVESLSFQKSAVISVTNPQDVGDTKGEELPGFGSSPSKQLLEQNGQNISLRNGANEQGIVSLRETREQEVSELYLERVYQKPAAHDFYCPNCKSCITKVIIRGREWEDTPPTAPPPVIDDPIRCTSCFSFLIPAGSLFFPTKVPKEDKKHTEEVISHDRDESLNDKKPAMPTQPDGVGEDASIDKAPVPGEPVEDSFGVAAIAKPSRNSYESGVRGEEPVPSHDSDETFPNQKPPVPVQPVGDSVLVTTKYPAPEIDVVAGTPHLEDTDAGPAKTEIPERTVVDIRPEPTIIPVPGDTKTVEILKSIVYGGLTEAVTSLSIVTSAASADTATLYIVALALANLIGGLFIIGHNLWELKDDQSKVPSSETEEQADKYQKVLGKRENFPLHASVAVLSFIVFGLVPPLVYGFSFRQSNNRDLKIAAVAIASLLCIIVLAIGKAYIQRPQKYIKTLLYYIAMAIGVGGISYLAGDLIDKLIEKLGWFSSNVSGTRPLPQMGIVKPALQSY